MPAEQPLPSPPRPVLPFPRGLVAAACSLLAAGCVYVVTVHLHQEWGTNTALVLPCAIAALPLAVASVVTLFGANFRYPTRPDLLTAARLAMLLQLAAWAYFIYQVLHPANNPGTLH